MSFESELRASLRRKSPPPGFTESVMRAIAAEQQRPRSGMRRAGWLAVAATVLVASIGGWTAHRVEKRREGERAKEQLMLALHVTSKKLRDTQQHVQDISPR